VVEHLSSMYKTLGSIPTTQNQIKNFLLCVGKNSFAALSPCLEGIWQ
jgi:hypothetical protein